MTTIEAPTKSPITEIGDADLEPGEVTHIVVPHTMRAKYTPEAYVMQARINGTTIRALCGYVWVPHRDPQKLPKCRPCCDILDAAVEKRHGPQGRS